MPSSARSAARTAESNPAFRVAARAGYVANGILHLLIGVLVLAVGLGGTEETDQTGAFRAVAAVPLGALALGALAVGLVALGCWHLLQAVAPRGLSGWKRLARIAAEAPQGIVFVAIGLISASVALGARPRAEQATEDASEFVLTLPIGGFVLGAVGLTVAGVGVGFVWMGARRSFRTKVRLPHGRRGHLLSALGVAGFLAKGVALMIVGVLLVIAAVKIEPDTAGGLDGAVSALIALPAGPFLAFLVGVGFLAYGVFTVFRARYARLDV
ncbi:MULTISPECIES: DUF1206 domain-containing protein [Microbacterium]|uniref:DUF1206 domain-containing protein n=1 Tax=Microbacterium TaxID=33882 RepID=UPI00278873B8|nr:MULTISPECIES: DUF1206 domain-containing protein [Microbacterium]MDQ1083438.1 hypothetical protein [Microbacterium sp. SORGH_AS_0344]MDQ1171282.1 hypothetical protein [Microbacterium proteolyticum]